MFHSKSRTASSSILGLLDNPTSGSYELLGHEVAKLKEKDRTKFRKGNIGFVFQSFNLIDELNVYENVELPLRYLNISASERKQKVTEILKRMNPQGTAFPSAALRRPAAEGGHRACSGRRAEADPG